MGIYVTKFLYLKLGGGNCLAEYWLSKDNLYKSPVAAIYFGPVKAEEYRELVRIPKKEKETRKEKYEDLCEKYGMKRPKNPFFRLNQVRGFIEAGETTRKKGVQRTKFVTIGLGTVYIYEPESDVFDMKQKEYAEYDNGLSKLSRRYGKKHPELRARIDGSKIKDPKGRIRHIPKCMYVRLLATPKIGGVPHVLATLPCNQYFTRGTCREIDDWGVIQAVKHCLGRQIDTLELSKSPEKLVELLSPYELETLVFLILRNEGLFVPAWRGGTQKDIDIIAINREYREITIGKDLQVTFDARGKKRDALAFQVKRGKVKAPSEVADYTITDHFDGKNDKVLTAKWLLQQVKTPTQIETREWLLNSLNWIPIVDSLISNHTDPHEDAKEFEEEVSQDHRRNLKNLNDQKGQ